MKTTFAVMALAAAVLAGPAQGQAQTTGGNGGGFSGGNGGQQGGSGGGFSGGNGGQQGGNGGGFGGGNGGQQGGNGGGFGGGNGGQQGGNWGGGHGWLPQGSYQHSCRSATVRGTGRNATLTASCQDGRGRWNYTSIRIQDCRDDIRNDGGRLACGWSGGGGGRPPPWQGQGGITLFSSTDFGGQPFQTSREITNLPRQYNDRAMSLRIEGRGAWQVCADSNFRGRCQIFSRDVRDLRQYGLGEAVSSMRPVQGQGPGPY